MPSTTYDRTAALASIDAERAEAVKNLRSFEEAHRRAASSTLRPDVSAAVGVGIEALRAHLRDLSDQRARLTA